MAFKYDILKELWSRENSSVSGSCSHTASSLHDGALLLRGWHNEQFCSSETWISGRVPEPVW